MKWLKVTALSLCIIFCATTAAFAGEAEVILKILLKKKIITQKEYNAAMKEFIVIAGKAPAAGKAPVAAGAPDTATLEKRVAEVEKKADALTQKTDQIEKDTLVATNVPPQSIPQPAEGGGITEVLKKTTLGGNVVMVGQGSAGNKKNYPPGEDVTDGNVRADINLTFPLGKNDTLFVDLRGGAGRGLDGDGRIRSFFGVNATGTTDENPYMSLYEAWYEHRFLDDMIKFRVGKIDLTTIYNTNVMTTDETVHFLSPGLTNSAALDWPSATSMGASVTVSPASIVDLSLAYEPGDGKNENIFSRPFVIGEIGVKPKIGTLQGNYRVLGWTNRKPNIDYSTAAPMTASQVRQIYEPFSSSTYSKSNLALRSTLRNGDEPEPTTTRNGWGIGTSIDQQVLDFLTLYAKAGYQNNNVYPYSVAWAGGFGLSGSIWGRNNDELGAAFGMAHLSSKYKDFLVRSSLSPANEKHLEVYYRIQVNKQIAISPDIQLVSDGLGIGNSHDVWLFGIRGNFTF